MSFSEILPTCAGCKELTDTDLHAFLFGRLTQTLTQASSRMDQVYSVVMLGFPVGFHTRENTTAERRR